MPKRKSPATGRDPSNGPDPADIVKALAREIIDREAMDALKEQRKKHRKAAEGDGVVLAELDALYKLRDEPASEIENMFRRKWSTFTAFFTDLAEQLDLFVPRLSPERRAAYKHVGKMAGLTGAECLAPVELEGEELNDWVAGWHEGHDAREAAKADPLAALAQALNNAEAGLVTDGTTGLPVVAEVRPKRSHKAKAVGLQAAADFAADNPGFGPGPDEVIQ